MLGWRLWTVGGWWFVDAPCNYPFAENEEKCAEVGGANTFDGDAIKGEPRSREWAYYFILIETFIAPPARVPSLGAKKTETID